jgi:IclR family pca regulon transcriptional regulator
VALLDESDIVYIARAAQKRVMSVGLMPGSRLPAHCTSLGRVLLAALPREEAAGLVERSDLTPRTRFSLVEPKDIMTRIDDARDKGFALVNQEVELGLRSIAVPLMGRHGTVVAALNIGLPATDAPPEATVDEYLPHLLRLQSAMGRVL